MLPSSPMLHREPNPILQQLGSFPLDWQRAGIFSALPNISAISRCFPPLRPSTAPQTSIHAVPILDLPSTRDDREPRFERGTKRAATELSFAGQSSFLLATPLPVLVPRLTKRCSGSAMWPEMQRGQERGCRLPRSTPLCVDCHLTWA